VRPSGRFDARSEAASTKPAFRDGLKSCRCLIPADGFYEWFAEAERETKQPYCFEVNAGELFAFAGLRDRWKDPSGLWVKTCSILTTTPIALTSTIHDRMRVILDSDGYDLSRNAECDCGVRTVEAFRCPADAVLSGEHSHQQRGERRPRMLSTCGHHRASESTFHLRNTAPSECRAVHPDCGKMLQHECLSGVYEEPREPNRPVKSSNARCRRIRV
jgi:hypothetical protein